MIRTLKLDRERKYLSFGVRNFQRCVRRERELDKTHSLQVWFAARSGADGAVRCLSRLKQPAVNGRAL
jgi:hypothetical protein